MGRRRHHRDPAATGRGAQGYAERIAKAAFDKGMASLDIGEKPPHDRLIPARGRARPVLASTDLERQYRCAGCTTPQPAMLGTIAKVYAPTAQYHGPLMAELTAMPRSSTRTLPDRQHP